MALESVCGLSIRGKMFRADPYDLDVTGVDIKAEMLGLHSEPDFLVQSPPFVSSIDLSPWIIIAEF